MRPIQMLLNAQLMNTDWVSSAQFTAPDSPLGKKEAEPAALKLRHAFQKFDQPMHTGIEHNDPFKFSNATMLQPDSVLYARYILYISVGVIYITLYLCIYGGCL